MKISIKNMVCQRCISSVQQIFDAQNIPLSSNQLGEVETKNSISELEFTLLKEQLKESGFEILQDQSKIKIDRIKTLLIEEISTLDIPEDFVLSKFISEKLSSDYSALSKLFSHTENYTIEQYFILQKVEKVKELLVYDEFTLTQISQQLGYKSVQHLSNQFKKITGYAPTQFQNLKKKSRIELDKI